MACHGNMQCWSAWWRLQMFYPSIGQRFIQQFAKQHRHSTIQSEHIGSLALTVFPHPDSGTSNLNMLHGCWWFNACFQAICSSKHHDVQFHASLWFTCESFLACVVCVMAIAQDVVAILCYCSPAVPEMFAPSTSLCKTCWMWMNAGLSQKTGNVKLLKHNVSWSGTCLLIPDQGKWNSVNNTAFGSKEVVPWNLCSRFSFATKYFISMTRSTGSTHAIALPHVSNKSFAIVFVCLSAPSAVWLKTTSRITSMPWRWSSP